MSAAEHLNSLTTRRAFRRRGTLATLAIPAGHTAPVVPPSLEAEAVEMDAMHEAGVKAFPARTEGKGNQLLAPRMDRGVKVYDLTCSEVQWEISPGERMKAWVYNEQLPGPEIRVREGDRVRINVRNRLPESTCVHFHGLEVPNDQDGVPFITQKPIKPGASHTYEFTVPNPGSHMYHSHHNAAKQVRLHPQRQGISGHRADRGQAGSEDPHPVHERGDADPSDASPRDAHDRYRQGRMEPAGAVEVRYAEHRSRRALGRVGERH